MKKAFLTAGFVLALTIAFNSTNNVHSDPGGAPTGNTGAPKATTGTETTCARSGCHGSNLNNGPHSVALAIAGDSASYTPGQSYSMTVSVVNPTGSAAGFQLVCLNPAKANVGTWTTGTGTKIVTGSGRSYLTHTNRTRRFWTFTWNAPTAATAPDSVTFYFASQETVSGNFNTYTGKKVFHKKVVLTGTSELVSTQDFQLFPVPTAEKLSISLPDFTLANQVEILGLDSRLLLQKDILPGISIVQLDMPTDMKPGHYFIRIRNEHGSSVKRFIKI